jgi:hypothetical protein
VVFSEKYLKSVYCMQKLLFFHDQPVQRGDARFVRMKPVGDRVRTTTTPPNPVNLTYNALSFEVLAPSFERIRRLVRRLLPRQALYGLRVIRS